MLSNHSLSHTLLFPFFKPERDSNGVKRQAPANWFAVKMPSSAVGITVAKNAIRICPPRLEANSHHHEDIRACCESTSVEGRFVPLRRIC
jgi:hypothetical protein